MLPFGKINVPGSRPPVFVMTVGVCLAFEILLMSCVVRNVGVGVAETRLEHLFQVNYFLFRNNFKSFTSLTFD